MTKIKSVEERAEAVDDGSERLNRIAIKEFTEDRISFEEAIVEAFRGLQVQPTEHGITRDDSVHNQAIDQAIATIRSIYQDNK